jgi:hypothetical protein
MYILNAQRSRFFLPEILGVRDFFAIECVDVAYINTYSCEGVAAKEALFIGAASHMQSFSLEQETSMYVPSNRVISSLEGKFVTVCATFVPVTARSFLKISNLCKNIL